jgi:hypothetical protein
LEKVHVKKVFTKKLNKKLLSWGETKSKGVFPLDFSSRVLGASLHEKSTIVISGETN